MELQNCLAIFVWKYNYVYFSRVIEEFLFVSRNLFREKFIWSVLSCILILVMFLISSSNTRTCRMVISYWMVRLTVILTTVCRRFESPSYIGNPPIWPSPLHIFFSNPPPLTTCFWQYRRNDIRGKHKNKVMRESYFSCLEDYKTML